MRNSFVMRKKPSQPFGKFMPTHNPRSGPRESGTPLIKQNGFKKCVRNVINWLADLLKHGCGYFVCD